MGEAVLVFADEKILSLVTSVLGDTIPSDLSRELEEDVLAEAGNISLGACMSTFTDNLQLDFSPMAPRVTHCSAAQWLGIDY